MRVCLISTELFGRGSYGGFGRAARRIGRGLVERGIEVTMLFPVRRGTTPSSYELDGMQVRELRPHAITGPMQLARVSDADVYHSSNPSLATYLAMRAMPQRAHVITIRDARTPRDWLTEWRTSHERGALWPLWPLYVDNPLVNQAVRRASSVYVSSHSFATKAGRKYHLRTTPPFLPTPTDVPERVEKAGEPTVCFVGRWDGVKRPEVFLELAREFPDVHFVAVGATRDAGRDARLRRLASGIPNVEATGAIDQFGSTRLAEIYSRSWILVNTSLYESHPNAFLEAAASRCAILSLVDAGEFPSRFGYHAADGDLAAGLRHLLEGNRWREAGERAHRHVAEVFGADQAMEAHLRAYDEALKRRT